jgi:5-methylthioadenosine/S-adenosylhomocysteine deaminase
VFGIEATPDTPTIVSQLKSKVAVMRAQVARAGGDDRVQIGISPHAPYTVRPDLLTALQEWAMREGLPSTIHVAESGGEVELISSGKGPFGEMFARRGIQWSVPGGSPVAYLDTCQALGPNVLAVHCVHVSEADIATLKARSVSVAHCPKSNGKLGAGIAPVAAMRRAGVRVGIGTDSMVSNNGADMFEEMRMVLYFARAHAQSPDALTAKDALHMATLGGAEALELDKQVGSLTGGKLADICAVRLDGLNAFPTGEDNPQAALVYGARASDVAWTMVNGRVLYESGRHTLVDVPRLKNALRPLRAHLHQQTEKLLGKAY